MTLLFPIAWLIFMICFVLLVVGMSNLQGNALMKHQDIRFMGDDLWD